MNAHANPSTWSRLGLAGSLSFLALAAVGLGSATAHAQVPVNIESTPPGATVYVNAVGGAPLGVTPMRSVRLPRGPAILIFRMDGYGEGRLPISVSRRRETFRIALAAMGTLSVNASNDAAQGAAVRVDGVPVGNIPYRAGVQPGRHLVQIGREGYVTFSQWVELAGGQVLTLPVSLEQERPSTGSVLVASDVSGAPVFVDGEPRGSTPTVIENVTAGQHQIEIRPPGLDVHRETVTIIAGQRISLNPTLRPAAPAGGSLRVIANVPAAVISLDGETLGNAPASRENVSPGEHILEATAEGYMPVQQPVTIVSGQQRVVSLQLRRQEAPPGRIVINANVSGAIVTIDNEERGRAPTVVENATAGTHAVIVRATGYQDYTQTCSVGPGQNCELNAVLEPIGTPVRVSANTESAVLFLDDREMGPIPYEGNLPVGNHRIEVRAEGYRPHNQVINLEASTEPRVIDVALRRISSGPSEEELEALAEEEAHRRFGAVSHAGGALPRDQAVIDLSVGWPFLGEVRLSVGIFDYLEAGFAIRSFGRLTEFEGRAEVGIRPVRQLAVSAQARFGGGLGPSNNTAAVMMGGPELTHNTNSWFYALEALGTLYFSDRGAFTLVLGVEGFTDRWDFKGDNSDVLCSASTSMPVSLPTCGGTMTGMSIGRQAQTRLHLGGSLEIVLGRQWNAWGTLDGVLVGPSESRRIYGDILGLGAEDTELYLRLGVTHKF